MSLRQDIAPMTFGIGFLAEGFDLLLRNPWHREEHIPRLLFFMYGLLLQWGLQWDEIDEARQLVVDLADHDTAQLTAYRQAARAFARSTPSRRRLWCVHMAAIAIFQTEILGRGDMPHMQALMLEHMRRTLELDQATYVGLIQQAVGLSTAALGACHTGR